MFPRDDAVKGDARLAAALATLPAPPPPADGWARLEAELARRPRPPGRPFVVGFVAAGVAAAVVAIGTTLRPAPRETPPAVSEPPAAAAIVAAADPAALRRRSVELEEVLATLPDGRLTRASTGLTAALLEDRIAAVDAHLSVAPLTGLPDDATADLLRQRVLLLDSLVRVRYAAAMDATY